MKYIKRYDELNEGIVTSTSTLMFYFLFKFIQGIVEHIMYDNNKEAKILYKMIKVVIYYFNDEKDKIKIEKNNDTIDIVIDNKEKYKIKINITEIIFKLSHYNILLKRDVNYHFILKLDSGEVFYEKNGEVTYTSTISDRIILKIKKLIKKLNEKIKNI